MQYLYSMENLDRNFLCSYARAALQKDRLIFVNTLTDRSLAVRGESGALNALLDALKKGVRDGELRSLLTSCGAGEMLELLWQEGMIE